jgi:hypothetical protein
VKPGSVTKSGPWLPDPWSVGAPSPVPWTLRAGCPVIMSVILNRFPNGSGRCASVQTLFDEHGGPPRRFSAGLVSLSMILTLFTCHLLKNERLGYKLGYKRHLKVQFKVIVQVLELSEAHLASSSKDICPCGLDLVSLDP